MRWAGHIERMGEKRNEYNYWWESERERAHWKDQDVSRWIILGWIL
jgi:hypothetical protein